MLLTAGSRVASTNQRWNEGRTRLANQGESPSLVEPVSGTLTLRGLERAAAVSALALDGAGQAIGDAVAAKKTGEGWVLPVGEPVTTWYVVSVKR
jgi:hypothetical protein